MSQRVQYTLRQVPAAIDRALREKARKEKRSLNETTIQVLKTGLEIGGTPPVHKDLDFMIGTWVEDAAFEEAIRSQDQIDPELWK